MLRFAPAVAAVAVIALGVMLVVRSLVELQRL
jgi:hypothetical protein